MQKTLWKLAIDVVEITTYMLKDVWVEFVKRTFVGLKG